MLSFVLYTLSTFILGCVTFHAIVMWEHVNTEYKLRLLIALLLCIFGFIATLISFCSLLSELGL